jgi:hypothetical protein
VYVRKSPLSLTRRMTNECFTPVRDQAAAAVPRSAAGCQRIPRDGDLGHLECDIAPVADDVDGLSSKAS